jgi:hypothetical protein
MIEKFLPIGSVVLLKNGKKRIMITGYCIVEQENSGNIYDYCGVIYPEGMLSSKQTLLFNHNQISTISYLGLIDQEFRNFENKLKTEITKQNIGNKNEC